MYQTKNLGLNITEIDKDSLQAFNFDTDLGDNFKAIDEKTLSHRNITNCLLEVPQDIKAECSNGTLTIKAGSKIWVPYGTEDKTIEYPVGSAFLNANFTVVDTQYSDGKFFVLAELQEDIQDMTTTTVEAYANIEIRVDTNVLIFKGSYDNTFSYDTDQNLIIDTDETTAVFCFPLGVCTLNTTGVTSIDQVFNGFGYIGSTVFALPGVKGLIPNGKNEDGSLNNIAYTVSDVSAYTWNASYSGDYENIIFTNSVITGNSGWAEYKEKENVIWDNTTNTSFLALPFCNTTILNGAITSFTPKKPFRAVDYNDYQTKITELETKIATLQAAVEALQGS